MRSRWPAYLFFALLVWGSNTLLLAEPSHQVMQLIRAARSQIGVTTGYDGSYERLAYPGGDVDQSTGVCTDVINRAYRIVGFDLQKLIHEDMKAHFDKYPSKRIWGLTKPDSNIDHRRVPNMQTFFERQGATIEEQEPQAGDLMTFELPGGLPHIGIVSSRRGDYADRPLIIHNIGNGTVEEDVIALYKQTGLYRYRPWSQD